MRVIPEYDNRDASETWIPVTEASLLEVSTKDFIHMIMENNPDGKEYIQGILDEFKSPCEHDYQDAYDNGEWWCTFCGDHQVPNPPKPFFED